MSDTVFHIVAEHELAAGGLPVRTEHRAVSPGGVVAIVAAMVEWPGFRSVAVETEAGEQLLALAA